MSGAAASDKSSYYDLYYGETTNNYYGVSKYTGYLAYHKTNYDNYYYKYSGDRDQGYYYQYSPKNETSLTEQGEKILSQPQYRLLL